MNRRLPRVRITRNPRTPGRAWWIRAKLPVRQTLYFAGPIFVLVQWRTP